MLQIPIDKEGTKKYMLKCEGCGHTSNIELKGVITENNKHCEECGASIAESNIYESRQELLLE